MLEQRDEHEQAPQADDDARHRGDEVDQHRQGLGKPARRHLGEIGGGADADRDGEQEREECGNQRADDEDASPVDLPAVVPGSRPQEREAGVAERLARPRDQRDDKAEQHRGEHQHPQPAQEGIAPAPTPGAVALDGLPDPGDGHPVLGRDLLEQRRGRDRLPAPVEDLHANKGWPLAVCRVSSVVCARLTALSGMGA